jgi:hypothetical protein
MVSYFFQCRNYALIYHGVHCSYVSLGQTLMPDGHVDNFLIPCFCRKLFEDNHPSKSGRHYFFSYIGVCNFLWFFLMCLLVILHFFHLVCCILSSSFSWQESILLLSSEMQESMVRTSFLGAASASKGKRLDFSDRVCF